MISEANADMSTHAPMTDELSIKSAVSIFFSATCTYDDDSPA